MTSAPVRDPLADHLLAPPERGAAVHRLPARAAARVRSMDRALLVKNAVSTVKTIKTLRGSGGALDRQRRRRPGQPTLPDLAGRLSTGPPPSQQEVLAIAEKWRPCRRPTTSYLFSAASEPAEAPPVARHRTA